MSDNTIQVNTHIFQNGIIEQEVVNTSSTIHGLAKEVFDTKEQHLRDALMNMGWSTPEQTKELQESNKRPAPCKYACEQVAFKSQIGRLEADNKRLREALAERDREFIKGLHLLRDSFIDCYDRREFESQVDNLIKSITKDSESN